MDVDTATPVTWYIHSDHFNRPIAVTDTAGAPVHEAWLPFGEATGSYALNARFPGQWFQSENGLHYNWHRHYDPTIGRYTQADPLGFVDGPSVYAYALNSPQMYIDPTGEFGVVGAIIGGGFDLGLQLALNGGNWKCVDWADVAVSAAVGAIAPGLLSAGKTFWTSSSAIRHLSRQASRAQTANRRTKIKNRIGRHKSDLGKALATQAAWQGIKQIGKSVGNYQQGD
ncbi:MAG: RHS repeat-associated core domain-containing protein [Rhizobiaceae bacterium]|nr:RHS repeat-associated core domain-containing protein [Rhizobiaceae bacterium]